MDHKEVRVMIESTVELADHCARKDTHNNYCHAVSFMHEAIGMAKVGDPDSLPSLNAKLREYERGRTRTTIKIG